MTNYFEDDGPKQWTLADVYDDLCATADVPPLLDVSKWRVARWIHRRERIKCPQPIRRISHVDVYSKQEWIAWFEVWNKKHKSNTRWTDKAQPHGAGEPFFEYFDQDDEGDD